MVVNKYIFFFSFLLIWNFLSAQDKNTFPKDTIYVKYEDKEGNNKIINWKYWGYKESRGVYFSIRDNSKETNNQEYLSLFYPYTQKADTLPISYLNQYRFSDLKEIEEKKREWTNKKYKSLDIKPYTKFKNVAFQTYLIEIISEDSVVKYPVVWRNEGVIP